MIGVAVCAVVTPFDDGMCPWIILRAPHVGLNFSRSSLTDTLAFLF